MWTGIRLTGDFYLRVEKGTGSGWVAELTDYPTGAVLTVGKGKTAEAAAGAALLAYFDHREGDHDLGRKRTAGAAG